MDLLLDSNGDMVFSNTTTPITKTKAEDVAQRLSIKLKTNLGEWFLDTSVGVPWIAGRENSIFGWKRTKQFVDSELQQQILSEDDVESILSFNSEFNTAQRNYSLSGVVKCTNGDTATVNVTI